MPACSCLAAVASSATAARTEGGELPGGMAGPRLHVDHRLVAGVRQPVNAKLASMVNP